MPRPIRRRTAEIELWDVNPVGTSEAWRRELLQFWSLLLTRGRRVRAPSYMTTLDYANGKNRPITTKELAHLIAERVANLPGALVGEERKRDVERWLRDSVIVSGERRGRSTDLPAAGVRIPHYAGLLVFNRAVTRERFWAAFFYSAFKTDLEAGPILGEERLAGQLLEGFLSAGLRLDRPAFVAGQPVGWEIDFPTIAAADPEILLVTRALAAPADEKLPSAATGLPSSYFATATKTVKGTYDQFLCPGTIIQLRRATSLLLSADVSLGHAALSDMLETVLVNHAAIYFIRGMKVLNDLNAGRQLDSACASCWDRFQPDLRDDDGGARIERWRSGDYRGRADAADASWVEANCTVGQEVFVNAGRKEHTAAKDLARLSLEQLRRQLASYTVNRIATSIALEVAGALATTLGENPPELAEVYSRLDRWAESAGTRVALSVLWVQKISQLATDKDVPGVVLENLDGKLRAAAGTPRALEDVARDVIAEAILSARAFTRYIELLNSLLGGGALPTNQDPKGLLARGGSRATPFHITLNDKALESFVALISLESEAQGEPLSFARLVETLRSRYGFLVDRAPDGTPATAGLVAEASAQSREALRSRLHSMGFLQEFSDSSEWNRVSWREGRSR